MASLPKIDDNMFYRLMNNSQMDWRRLLLSFAKQFRGIAENKSDNNPSTICFVVDDTDIEKTGKTMECISRIFSHVTKLYPLGYKVLLLAYHDGKSLIPVDFSLHREMGSKKNFGLSTKEKNGTIQQKTRPKNTHI